MTTAENNQLASADQEKRSAALSSVIAAIALTSFKIVVGIFTGSLGILAEAAHSGLDLVAALVTFFAVRISGKPADPHHNYGHGKIENLSALFETVLLLITAVWIIYEAAQRLFFHPVEVEVSFWSFLVMAVSIVIDFTRSRVLLKAAKRHNSQALEADALHFSTDIWSSSVVILGLICLLIAKAVPSLSFLDKADAVAATVVALIVIYVSIEMGMRTIQGLLDTAPEEMQEKVTAAAMSVPGVLDVHNIRARHSGPILFIDAHVSFQGDITLSDTHRLMNEVETAIRSVAPGADITVHPEPVEGTQEIGESQA
jgi:cation diffusion facilitator family transporter